MDVHHHSGKALEDQSWPQTGLGRNLSKAGAQSLPKIETGYSKLPSVKRFHSELEHHHP